MYNLDPLIQLHSGAAELDMGKQVIIKAHTIMHNYIPHTPHVSFFRRFTRLFSTATGESGLSLQ